MCYFASTHTVPSPRRWDACFAGSFTASRVATKRHALHHILYFRTELPLFTFWRLFCGWHANILQIQRTCMFSILSEVPNSLSCLLDINLLWRIGHDPKIGQECTLKGKTGQMPKRILQGGNGPTWIGVVCKHVQISGRHAYC